MKAERKIANDQNSPLLRLPAELRNEIYSLVVGENRDHFVSFGPRFLSEEDHKHYAVFYGLNGLSQASRRLHMETEKLWWSNNKFVFSVGELKICDKLKRYAKFLDIFPDATLAYINKIAFSIDVPEHLDCGMDESVIVLAVQVSIDRDTEVMSVVNELHPKSDLQPSLKQCEKCWERYLLGIEPWVAKTRSRGLHTKHTKWCGDDLKRILQCIQAARSGPEFRRYCEGEECEVELT